MFEVLHSGELYFPQAGEITEIQMQAQEKMFVYNQTRPTEREKRARLLREMFLEFGEHSIIEAPFYANWGGHFVRVGSHVYANFGLKLVDDTFITIGDYTMIGPNVVLAAAGHPVLPELREQGLQFNAPVVIGRNCWLGAGVLVMPGVTVGDNTVVGAGSVVTKDLPAHVVAVGNPCRVLREIGEKDRELYFRDRRIPPELL